MFSSRIHWDLEPNRISRLLAEKRGVLDLTESNPTAAGFEYPEGLLASLNNAASLLYEPAAAGLLSAREAVAGYYASRGGSVDPSRLLLTTSTSESYGFLFKLLCEPGDEILVPRPSYPLFEFLAALESVKVHQYPLRYHGEWSIDFEALEGLISEGTRAVVLVNPNNPTGSFLKRSELDHLTALCARRNLAIISDEVFADYAFEEDPRRAPSLTNVDAALTFCLSGLSKVSALPQMKLGWIAVSGPGPVAREAYERLEWIADTYLSVSAPVQHAAKATLDARIPLQRQMKARLRRNLEFLRDRVAGSSAQVLEVEGGWYATLRMPRIRTEEEWVLHFLSERDVLVQPGFFYDFESEAFLVLSLLTSEDVFRAGVDRMMRS